MKPFESPTMSPFGENRPPHMFINWLFSGTAIVILLTFGCSRSSKSESPPTNADTAASGARISAVPNPVLAGSNHGSTSISWDSGDKSLVEVYVSVDGGQEKIFAKSQKGSSEAPWIWAGRMYEFRLYQAPNRVKLLDSVKVTFHGGPGERK